MAYRIQLTRYAVENINWLTYGTYRMRIEVTAVEGDGIDPYIFVYQRRPQSPYNDEPCDEFVAIAGPAQIADIPAGAPEADHYWPFFRLSYVELDFTAEELAMEVWNTVQREAAILCEGFERYTQLVAQEDVWVPTMPDESSESASSE